MKTVIEVWVDLPENVSFMISEPLRIESMSSPPGGKVKVSSPDDRSSPILEMGSEDPSTARAMLNSYLGLLSVAMRTASVEK